MKKKNCQVSKFVSLSKQIFKKKFFLSSWGKSLAPQTKLFLLEKTKVEWKNGTNIFHKFSDIPKIRAETLTYWISIFKVSTEKSLPMAKNFHFFGKMKSLEITILLTEIKHVLYLFSGLMVLVLFSFLILQLENFQNWNNN